MPRITTGSRRNHVYIEEPSVQNEASKCSRLDEWTMNLIVSEDVRAREITNSIQSFYLRTAHCQMVEGQHYDFIWQTSIFFLILVHIQIEKHYKLRHSATTRRRNLLKMSTCLSFFDEFNDMPKGTGFRKKKWGPQRFGAFQRTRGPLFWSKNVGRIFVDTIPK